MMLGLANSATILSLFAQRIGKPCGIGICRLPIAGMDERYILAEALYYAFHRKDEFGGDMVRALHEQLGPDCTMLNPFGDFARTPWNRLSCETIQRMRDSLDYAFEQSVIKN